MQTLKAILSAPLTWETIAFICAIILLCGKHIRIFCHSWIDKNQKKILSEIDSAAQLETEAQQLLQQYKKQLKEQQDRQADFQKQITQEILAVQEDIRHKTTQALTQQAEATDIHIRLIATQHQHKMADDLLKNVSQKTQQALKKQSKEDMDATINHLFECLDNHQDIFIQL